MVTQDLASLRANPRNPRKITDKKLEMLKRSMAEFGDLSGIVQLDSDGSLVGGHQRVAAFRNDPTARLQVTQTHDPALPDGTVAVGYVEAAGTRFAYRRCQWSAAKAKAANLAANKNAGSWDVPMLAEEMADLQQQDVDLDTTMFSRNERESLMMSEHVETPMGDEDAQPTSLELTTCPSCGHEFTKGASE